MMKFWRYESFDHAMDQGYLNAMMLNATLPSHDDKGNSGSSSPAPMSLFELGEKLAGLK